MRIAVVAFGKLKTPGLAPAIEHYIKMASIWAKIEHIELKPLAVPGKDPATRARIQEAEAQLLRARLSGILKNPSDYFLLDESGRQLTSHAWSAFLGVCQNDVSGTVAFCVGSSLGFSKGLKTQAKAVLSLGAQTLPHELARVVLYEQLYRALSILKRHPYHNEG